MFKRLAYKSLQPKKKQSLIFLRLLALIFLITAFLLAKPNTAAFADAYEYDGAGRLIRVDYDNGKSISYTYDNNGNLLKIDSSEAMLKPSLAEIEASPELIKSSLFAKPVTVVARDQNGKPMEGVTIDADVKKIAGKGLFASVRPKSAVTRPDGIAEFKVRFGYFSKDGVVTFTAENFTTTVKQK